MSSAAPAHSTHSPPDLTTMMTTEVSRDPVQDWMDAHPEELRQHAGERVAIDPARGIVASGATYGEVSAALDAMGVPASADVVIVPVHA